MLISSTLVKVGTVCEMTDLVMNTLLRMMTVVNKGEELSGDDYSLFMCLCISFHHFIFISFLFFLFFKIFLIILLISTTPSPSSPPEIPQTIICHQPPPPPHMSPLPSSAQQPMDIMPQMTREEMMWQCEASSSDHPFFSHQYLHHLPPPPPWVSGRITLWMCESLLGRGWQCVERGWRVTVSITSRFPHPIPIVGIRSHFYPSHYHLSHLSPIWFQYDDDEISFLFNHGWFEVYFSVEREGFWVLLFDTLRDLRCNNNPISTNNESTMNYHVCGGCVEMDMKGGDGGGGWMSVELMSHTHITTHNPHLNLEWWWRRWVVLLSHHHHHFRSVQYHLMPSSPPQSHMMWGSSRRSWGGCRDSRDSRFIIDILNWVDFTSIIIVVVGI